jgi:predicted nucleotidyltransferase
MRFEDTLSRVLGELKSRFGNDLVSVVLFGSHARGNAHWHSDVDLLVVANNLPSGWRKQDAVALAIEELGLVLGQAVQIILVSPGDVRYSVESIAPLMLEIWDAHRCVFDPEGFFAAQITRFTQNMTERGARKLRERVWEVPELVEA